MEHVNPESVKHLIFYSINFVAFMAIAVWLLRKPLRTFMETRSRTLKDAIERAQQMSREAQSRLQEYSGRLDKIDHEVAGLREEARQQAEADKARVLKDTDLRIERLKKESESSMRSEVLRAQAMLRAEVAELAARQAGALVEKNLTPQDRAMFQQQLLDRLATQPPKGTT